MRNKKQKDDNADIVLDIGRKITNINAQLEYAINIREVAAKELDDGVAPWGVIPTSHSYNKMKYFSKADYEYFCDALCKGLKPRSADETEYAEISKCVHTQIMILYSIDCKITDYYKQKSELEARMNSEIELWDAADAVIKGKRR
ncbi:MAG: hypothetical protein FWG39_01335 [Alphaproteobacteria bacterium]|nr:hypothetical protein [Alphaproteobacteria bacterium]